MARTLRVDEIYSSTGTISLPPGQGLDLSDCQSSLSLPRGTTVQEGTPVASGLRFDTDTGEFKSYGQSWNRFKNKVSRDYGNIVKAGLILELDTYRINSYPGSGNKWYSTTKKPITGTILGGPVFDSEEKYFTFDYANDRVDTTGFENYSYSSGITVSVWHYNGGGTGYYRGLVTNGISGDRIGGFDLRYGRENYFGGANNGTSLNWRITDSSGVATSRRIYANVGEWHNYVGTYDNSFVRVYKDGQLFDSIATSSGQIKTRPGSTIIGWSPDTSEYLDGRLSYVSIYNRGLSDEEILQNYNAIRERYQ